MKEELELDAQFGMEDLLCYVHVHQKSSTAHGSKCPMEKKGHSQRQSISGMKCWPEMKLSQDYQGLKSKATGTAFYKNNKLTCL